MKILTIFGTRPEAIKFTPVIREIEKHKSMEAVVLVTAQHREMLDQVLEIFKITPDYDLNIMKPGQTLSEITSRALLGIEKIINKEKPDLVLVQGDTTTAFVGALAAFYNQVKVGHIEAGLRTYDKFSPFPEEVNRQLISRITDLHFAPTENSRKNLIKEGIDSKTVFVTGNTSIDALKMTVKNDYNTKITDWIGKNKMILVTSHRRENLGDPMRHIFDAINRITRDFDVKVVFPVHLNRVVQDLAEEILGNNKNIKLIEPQGTSDFQNLMNKAYFVISDSGGIQEEAPSLGKPVLVTRDTTERPEGIEAGTLRLVGTNTDAIYSAAEELLTNQAVYKKMSKTKNPYGDGTAAKQIISAIKKSL